MSKYPWSYEYRSQHVNNGQWTQANGIWERASHAGQAAAERMAKDAAAHTVGDGQPFTETRLILIG